MGSTNAALSLRRFTQSSLSFKLATTVLPAIPVSPPTPLMPFDSRKQSFASASSHSGPGKIIYATQSSSRMRERGFPQ
ncbi:hypothetical protein Tcan_18211 [Toxocara canis]|uniref:Uncharacterized protein n=1 Tax=Toxocara canis TaxID=6265 RepID=A0A0B2V4T6_TOXCA|nr:hypothetical protein Tcan_18211 [Toxocara canis]